MIGLAIWETRGGARRNVTFLARQYSVNGERRSLALLRPISDQQTRFSTKPRLPVAHHASSTRSRMRSCAAVPPLSGIRELVWSFKGWKGEARARDCTAQAKL